jgi:hypothetical protein
MFSSQKVDNETTIYFDNGQVNIFKRRDSMYMAYSLTIVDFLNSEYYCRYADRFMEHEA